MVLVRGRYPLLRRFTGNSVNSSPGRSRAHHRRREVVERKNAADRRRGERIECPRGEGRRRWAAEAVQSSKSQVVPQSLHSARHVGAPGFPLWLISRRLPVPQLVHVSTFPPHFLDPVGRLPVEAEQSVGREDRIRFACCAPPHGVSAETDPGGDPRDGRFRHRTSGAPGRHEVVLFANPSPDQGAVGSKFLRSACSAGDGATLRNGHLHHLSRRAAQGLRGGGREAGDGDGDGDGHRGRLRGRDLLRRPHRCTRHRCGRRCRPRHLGDRLYRSRNHRCGRADGSDGRRDGRWDGRRRAAGGHVGELHR
jgi:hypothetical protein